MKSHDGVRQALPGVLPAKGATCTLVVMIIGSEIPPEGIAGGLTLTAVGTNISNSGDPGTQVQINILTYGSVYHEVDDNQGCSDICTGSIGGKVAAN